jgi:hypothetical protein
MGLHYGADEQIAPAVFPTHSVTVPSSAMRV